MVHEDNDWQAVTLRLLLTSLGLGLAMLAPFFLLDQNYAGIAAFLIGAGYMIVRVWLTERARPRKKRPPARVGWFIVLNSLGGMAAGSGVLLLALGSWMRWAYTDTVSGEYAAFLAELRNQPFDWAMSLILGSVALSGFSLLCLARPDNGAPSISRRIREYGPAVLHGTWLNTFAGTALLLAALQFVGPPIAMELLLDQLTVGREREFTDLLLTFPVVPLSVFTAAILSVAASVVLPERGVAEALVLGHSEGEPGGSAEAGMKRRVTTVMSVGGYVAATALAIHLLHFGVVAAIGSAQALKPAASVGGALDTWVIGQLTGHRPEIEIVETINEAGYWSPEALGQGLGEFLPDLEEELAGLNLDKSCRVTVAAAKADPAEQERIKWPEEYKPVENLEIMTVKYCVKTTCPSPTAWDSPPAISLWTSHPSWNRNWMYWIYFDLFARGRAPAPGGYCTADGKLAKDFQG